MGSHSKLYQCLSSILAANNDGEDIMLELGSLSSKYKSESGELFNDKQKYLMIHLLKKELLT